MLIHQDNPKRGLSLLEQGGGGGVPCLCSGCWALCQGGLAWVLTPKAPGWVVPGGNSAILEEHKEEEAEGLFSEPWVSPGILLKQNPGGGEVEEHEGQASFFFPLKSKWCSVCSLAGDGSQGTKKLLKTAAAG